MSDHRHEFDTDADQTPTRPGQLSSNAHWIFGSIYAVMALIGFSFGVWAGASKPKPVEVADAKQKDNTPKPNDPLPIKPAPPNANPNPNSNPAPTPVEPKPMDPKPVDPKPMDPEPKPKDPEPKPKDPDPKPPVKGDGGLASIGDGLTKEPGPKPPAFVGKAIAFKEVQPILRSHCGNCHGLAGKPKGGVDLTSVAAMKKGDKNGDPILVPGNPDKSTVYESITAGRMPDGGKPAPSAKELMLLRDWIAGGAKERRRTIRRRTGHRSLSRLELTPKGEAG